MYIWHGFPGSTASACPHHHDGSLGSASTTRTSPGPKGGNEQLAAGPLGCWATGLDAGPGGTTGESGGVTAPGCGTAGGDRDGAAGAGVTRGGRDGSGPADVATGIV